MKTPASALSAILLLAAVPMQVSAGRASPVGKVLEMLSDLQAKILKEGDEAKKIFDELSEWCKDRSRNLGFDIKTEKAEVASLTAIIEEETAITASLTSKIESLTATITTDEADVKAATEIRSMEASDFAAEERNLRDVIDTLERAILVLEKEMGKSGASMLQLKNAGSVAEALTVLVRSSALNTADAERLTALVQGGQEPESDDDVPVGAPAADVYKGHSRGIIETLQDLLDKANNQLSAARAAETANIHAFELLKQSLVDAIEYASKELAEAKKGLAESSAKKAAAEGDLEVTSKELSSDISTLAEVQETCITKSQEYEASSKSRAEELKALAEAQKVIAETTSGASKLSYSLVQPSLLQLTRMNLADFEAARFVRDLARKTGSAALTQLAARMAAARAGEDVFAKVKGLISDMIERLESEAAADASHKAFCDKELKYATEKKDYKESKVNKLSAEIDRMTSRSAQLKTEVAELTKALSELAAAQAEMDKLRKEEHAAFLQNKPDMEQGIEGVKLALQILRDYYASEKSHSAAEGAGAGIIGLLEVILSDFTKGLAEMIATEQEAQASYETETKNNEIEKTTKEQDVVYKTKEMQDLDKATAQAKADRTGVQAELDAVLEYLETLKAQCIEKAETFEERKARFEAELTGLREALRILEGEAVLLQQGSRRATKSVRRH